MGGGGGLLRAVRRGAGVATRARAGGTAAGAQLRAVRRGAGVATQLMRSLRLRAALPTIFAPNS